MDPYEMVLYSYSALYYETDPYKMVPYKLYLYDIDFL